jgi:membrane protein DedA with SNARE-associated domain
VRRSAVARGDRLYERYGPIAVFFSPSWAAGLAGMGAVAFLVANTLSALVWAAALGAGSYVAGPAVLDLFADVGLVGGIALGIVLAVGVVGGVARRQRAH